MFCCCWRWWVKMLWRGSWMHDFSCWENVNVATCLCFFPRSLQWHLIFFLLLVAQKPQYNGVLVCTLCSIFTQVCFDLLYSAKELVVGVINVCNHFVEGTMNLSRVKLCQELSSLQAVYISLIRNSACHGIFWIHITQSGSHISCFAWVSESPRSSARPNSERSALRLLLRRMLLAFMSWWSTCGTLSTCR